MDDQDIVTEEIARVIYSAKKENAWGKMESQYRGHWPNGPRAMNERLQAGDCDVGFAWAQAKAVMKYFKLDL